MVRIMKVLAAGNGKRLLGWLLLVFAWSVIIQLWLQNIVSAEAKWRIIPMALLLLNMAAEDYFHQTVDIRKVVALALLLFYISPKPVYLLLLRWISGCVVFLAFYAGALHYGEKGKFPKGLLQPQETPVALAFLPSFALALAADAFLYFGGYVLDSSLLPEIHAFLLLAWGFAPRAVCLWVAFLIGWYLFHGYRYIWHKDQKYAIVEGIGFGDVLVLPLFIAFFGWAEFSLIYTGALLIHLLRYGIIRCFARKGEDKVCP